MSAPTIRPAIASDAPALARMLDQLGYPTEASEIPKRLERMAERPGTTVFVAEQGGAPVGVVTVHLFTALHTSEPVAWLTALVVEETARGTGVGSALVQRAEEWAVRHGASRLALTSALRRTEAHQCYKTRDYVHTGVRLAKELSAESKHAVRGKSDEFHVLEFHHHDEAAAFVAAPSTGASAAQHAAASWGRDTAGLRLSPSTARAFGPRPGRKRPACSWTTAGPEPTSTSPSSVKGRGAADAEGDGAGAGDCASA